MKGLFTLTAMQLGDRFVSPKRKTKKRLVVDSVFTVLKFAVITAVIYIAFRFLSALNLVSMLPGIPQSVLLVLFTAMFFLSVAAGTAGLVRSLYFEKDNQVLLTFPVKGITVFASKLVVRFVYEYARNFTFFLPLLVAYGMIDGYPFYYYLLLPVANLLLTAVTVSIGALLSVPAMFVALFLRKVKVLGYIFIAAATFLVVFGVVRLILSLPPDINFVESWTTTFWEIQDFLSGFGRAFAPVNILLTAIVGTRYGSYVYFFMPSQLLYFSAISVCSAALIALLFVAVRPVYFRMVSSQFEHGASLKRRGGKNRRHGPFISGVIKEALLLVKNTDKLITLFSVAVGMPIAVLLLNSLFSSMNTRMLGNQLAVVFNVLMTLLFALSSNVDCSHSVGEEGNSAYLLRAAPSKPIVLLLAKLSVNAAVVTVSLAVTVSIISGYVRFSAVDAALLFVLVESVYLSHLFWSSEMDVMNPQNAAYATSGTVSYDPNEIRSGVYVFVLSFVFSLIVFFFIGKGEGVWIRAAAVALAFLVLRVWLYVNKVKIYFTERQS